MTTAMPAIDLTDEAFLREPHATYALARSEAPVYQVPGQDLVMVFGYDQVLEALMKPTVFSSRNEEALLGPSIHNPRCQEIYQQGWPQVETLLTNDPPSHTRFKKLVNRAFTRERVAGMAGHITAMVDKLIDDFIDRGRCEFVSEFAIPLPCIVIAQQLGIDEDDVPKVKAWSDAFIDLIGSELTPEEQEERAHQVVEFQHYVKARIDERRTEPREDMLTDLVNARVDDERPLDEAELLSVAQQMLVAANTTTSHMLSGGILTLIDNPEEFAKVRANPDLIPNMVEELLRLQTPTQGMWRRAVEDTELGGVKIPAGTMLDEAWVEQLDRLGIDEVVARSAITCSTRYGVCAQCYGRDLARGHKVNKGEAVGVIAAQSIGEPGTQLTMRTFHIGGAASRSAAANNVEVKNSGNAPVPGFTTISMPSPCKRSTNSCSRSTSVSRVTP